MMTHNFCLKLNKTLNEKAASRIKSAALAIGILLFYFFLPMPLSAVEEKPETKQQHSPHMKGTEEQGTVVAKVNGVEITQEALKAKMMRLIETRQIDIAAGESDSETLRKDALNKLILQELAYQRAKAEGISVGRDELDGIITEIKGKVGEEKYRETLEKRRITEEDLREELGKNLMVKRIFEKEVASQVTISEEDVKKEYDEIENEFSTPEKVVVADFVMFLDEDDKGAQDKAAVLIGKIKNYSGDNVLDLPSDGTFVVRELELNKNNQAELYAEAKKLSVGEVSGLISTPDSFHVLKLLKYSPEVKPQFSQVRGYIENRVRARKQQKKMAEWEAELKKDARIEIIETSGNGK